MIFPIFSNMFQNLLKFLSTFRKFLKEIRKLFLENFSNNYSNSPKNCFFLNYLFNSSDLGFKKKLIERIIFRENFRTDIPDFLNHFPKPAKILINFRKFSKEI